MNRQLVKLTGNAVAIQRSMSIGLDAATVIDVALNAFKSHSRRMEANSYITNVREVLLLIDSPVELEISLALLSSELESNRALGLEKIAQSSNMKLEIIKESWEKLNNYY